MLSEVRTKGYSHSIALLQAKRSEPALAKQIIALLEDRRALWESFDAEMPDRVRQSLDALRGRLVDLRSALPDGSPLDQVLLSLTKTILAFFGRVESIDLRALRCDGGDPEWLQFRDALAALRKAVGLQIDNIAAAYGVPVTSDLRRIMPLVPT